MKVQDDARLREQIAAEQAEADRRHRAWPSRDRLARGGKLILFGNGGSATDANDWALDCVLPPAGYRPIPAVSLSLEPANITAIANDVGTEVIFLRQLIAQARPEDMAVGISTSGGSRNIIMALEEARKRKLLTVALLGYDGGEILRRGLADFPLVVRSDYIPRIQEVQASIYHIIRELLEAYRPCRRLSSSERRAARTRRKCASGWNGRGRDFVEYDVEARSRTHSRACATATGGQRTVPVLLEDGKVTQIGWQGRGCVVSRGHQAMIAACSVHVRGVVQGVGFRPFVFRLAQANSLAGWVLNETNGVDIHLEGAEPALESFPARSLELEPPPAARITAIEVVPSEPAGLTGFHDSREPAAIGPANGSHLARSAGLRRLPRRAVRPVEPALRLSLYQLHQLRPALHRDRAPALRSSLTRLCRRGRWTLCAAAQYHDPTGPAFPRAADRLSQLWTAIFLEPAAYARNGDDCSAIAARTNRRRERASAAIIWPATRERSPQFTRCANANIAKKNRSR